ncbi:MAG: hypothetical protein ACFE0I_03235 [Elainellaceae cyanobacterium]
MSNQTNPKKRPRDPNLVTIDPVTVVVIITALLLVPLIVTGFISQ